jgi:hypothetical protein
MKEGEKDDKDVKDAKTSKAPGTWSPSPPTPAHQRYTLHRDFFAMRLAEHRKQRQTSQAKALAPRLPGAPRGGLS